MIHNLSHVAQAGRHNHLGPTITNLVAVGVENLDRDPGRLPGRDRLPVHLDLRVLRGGKPRCELDPVASPRLTPA